LFETTKMQLFGKKSKTPQEIVKAVKEKLPKLAQLMLSGNLGCSSVGGTSNSSNVSSPSGSSIIIASSGETGTMSGSGSGAGGSSSTGPTNLGSLIGLSNPASPGTDRKSIEKLQDEISKNLSAMKSILYGDKGKKKQKILTIMIVI
jgi:hypothetical protein